MRLIFVLIYGKMALYKVVAGNTLILGPVLAVYMNWISQLKAPCLILGY